MRTNIKRTHKGKLGIMVAAGLAASVAAIQADHIRYSELPASVQKKINKERGSNTIKSIERTTENGQVVYDVELSGPDTRASHVRMDSNGTLLTDRKHVEVNVGDAKVDVKSGNESHVLSTDKNDGKILGIAPAPGAKKNEVEVDLNKDHGVKAEANIDTNHPRVDVETKSDPDHGILNKHDGKILGVIPDPKKDKDRVDLDLKSDKEIKAEAGADTRNHGVETDTGSHHVDVQAGSNQGITSKTDGKILGVVPAPNKDKNRVDVDVDKDHGIKAETNIRTDHKSDYTAGNTSYDRDHTARVQANVDADKNGVNADIDTAPKKKGVFSKNDGKILGLFPAPSAKKNRAEVDVNTDKNLRSESTVTTETTRSTAIGGSPSVEKEHSASVQSDVNVGKSDSTAKYDKTTRGSLLGGKHLTMETVPNKVQETIRREAGANHVADIQEGKHKGQLAYKVDIQREGKNRKLEIAPDGTILSDSEGVTGRVDRSRSATQP
jgi:uncharacterized membrane protein YkoI